MAKGQQRSNRELKKPKKDKAKIAPDAPGSLWSNADKLRQGIDKKK